jgi:hypothetical protein
LLPEIEEVPKTKKTAVSVRVGTKAYIGYMLHKSKICTPYDYETCYQPKIMCSFTTRYLIFKQYIKAVD